MAGEIFGINEVPVTRKCIFYQEFTLQSRTKTSPRFLPLQSRQKLIPTSNVFHKIYSQWKERGKETMD